jgi:hypothetical protein
MTLRVGTGGGRAARMRLRASTLRTVAAAALATACIAALAPGNASAAIEIQTVPAVEGLRFAVRGTTYRTDPAGRVLLPTTAASLQRQARVLDTPVSRGVRAGLDRWYARRGIAAVAFFHRVRPRYINLRGNPVDASLVDTVIVKASHGGRYKFRQGEPAWVQVSRVVPKAGGRLRSQSVRYSVQSALVRGSNVVNAGQQRFRPSKTPVFPVQLLLYSVRFKTRDAFFGFPIGSAVQLQYPNGRVERHELDEQGRILVPSLPRSDYKVKVDAPGLSFERPVRLSRNQEVELEVMSWLDIALALFVLSAFALGLPLIRRPALRAAVRRAAPFRHPARTHSAGGLGGRR